MSEQTYGVRDTRKPRHGWFDHELFDVFGDELGQDGLLVYLTLTHMCRDNYQLKRKSLREMAAVGRMSKDTFSRKLKLLIEIGLVIETKGPTPQSASDYDLVDVKEFTHVFLRGRVSGRDTSAATPGRAGTEAPRAVAKRNDAAAVDDGAARQESAAEQDTENEAAEARFEDGAKCLPLRHMCDEPGREPGLSPIATEVSQNGGRFATEVSQAERHALTQEERSKKKDIPPTPRGESDSGSPGETLSFEDSRYGEADFKPKSWAAAAWVMEQDGVTAGVGQTKRLQQAIASALEREARGTRKELGELARTGAGNWTRYKALKAGRYQLNLDKFFVRVAWKPENWGVSALGREPGRPDATVGRYNGTAPRAVEGWAERGKRYAARLESWAAAIAATWLPTGVVEDLRKIAATLETGKPFSFEDLGAALEALDDQLDRAVFERASEEALDAAQQQVEALLRTEGHRLNPAQRAEARTRAVHRELRRTLNLPSLSHFDLENAAQ